MFLKNYTSEVPVSQTIARIRTVLIKCGVSGIMEEYDQQGQGKIIAITFQIPTATKPLTIRLPADEAAATDALFMDYADGETLTDDKQAIAWNGKSGNKKKRRKDFAEQGARTAWRIVQDWVEVQMSMIQCKQADTLQVFLPYVWDGRRTYYGHLKETGFAGLLPEKAGE